MAKPVINKNLGKAKRNGASIASPAKAPSGYVDSAATAHAGLKGKR